MSTSDRAALILGASRGLGLALAAEYLKRGWRVVATVRGSRPTALHDLAAASAGRLEIETVDINVPGQVAALGQRLRGRLFDLLFVNAGVAIRADAPAAELTDGEFTEMMITNALSPMRVIEAYQGLVQPRGVIAAMSSGLGSVADNEHGGWEGYRASKAALNMLMRSYAARQASPRTLLVVAPGWVRTDMGGPQATLGVEDSIPRIVDTIAAQAGTPGLRYVDYQGNTVRW